MYYSLLDRVIIKVDGLVSGLCAASIDQAAQASLASYPAANIPEQNLDTYQRNCAIGLMRVNYAGELAAQALYRAQALMAKDDPIECMMQQAAEEERQHLIWCHIRLRELGGRSSLLNPLWVSGSFFIGIVVASFGDKWNLSFVEETERQVVSHLQEHLHRLPIEDSRSRAILVQMQQDETAHADHAAAIGSLPLPVIAKFMMRQCAKLMTRGAYYI